MVLFSFSIPEMIELINNGAKHQTTRIPRKPRSNGEPAYNVGDKVQLYYRSRMAKSCLNCIQVCDARCENRDAWCKDWTKFFGESEITDIIHYNDSRYAENGNEIWIGYTLGNAPQEEREDWVLKDSGGIWTWEDADKFFVKSTKDKLWMFKHLDVIIWDKEPIIKRWKK